MTEPEQKPCPLGIAALAVVGLAFVLWAAAPIVAEIWGAWR